MENRTMTSKTVGQQVDSKGASKEYQEEAGERQRLVSFLASQEDSDRSFFMFFSSGLLHWLAKSLSLIPEEIPLILLGTDLLPEEKEWVELESGRPFFHFDLRVDDCSVLDMLLEACETGFGWIHIDCFVFFPDLFRELAAPAGELEAVRMIWTTGEMGDCPIAHSAFVFLEKAPWLALKEEGLRASLKPHSWQHSRQGRHAGDRAVLARVPTVEEERVASRVLSLTENGLMPYPDGFDYYPLLSWYQLLASIKGWRMLKIRDLTRVGGVSVGQFSHEVVHINGVATYRKVYQKFLRMREEDPDVEAPPLARFYPHLLMVEALLLEGIYRDLPDGYGKVREDLCGELEALDLDLEKAYGFLKKFLEETGVETEVLDRLVGS